LDIKTVILRGYSTDAQLSLCIPFFPELQASDNRGGHLLTRGSPRGFVA